MAQSSNWPDAGDELERRARVVADDAAQRDDLLVGGLAGRHRVARAVVVRACPRGREAQATGSEALGEQARHPRDLVGRRRPLVDRLAHDQPAQR